MTVANRYIILEYLATHHEELFSQYVTAGGPYIHILLSCTYNNIFARNQQHHNVSHSLCQANYLYKQV